MSVNQSPTSRCRSAAHQPTKRWVQRQGRTTRNRRTKNALWSTTHTHFLTFCRLHEGALSAAQGHYKPADTTSYLLVVIDVIDITGVSSLTQMSITADSCRGRRVCKGRGGLKAVTIIAIAVLLAGSLRRCSDARNRQLVSESVSRSGRAPTFTTCTQWWLHTAAGSHMASTLFGAPFRRHHRCRRCCRCCLYRDFALCLASLLASCVRRSCSSLLCRPALLRRQFPRMLPSPGRAGSPLLSARAALRLPSSASSLAHTVAATAASGGSRALLDCRWQWRLYASRRHHFGSCCFGWTGGGCSPSRASHAATSTRLGLQAGAQASNIPNELCYPRGPWLPSLDRRWEGTLRQR